jgi:hypothetical protein
MRLNGKVRFEARGRFDGVVGASSAAARLGIGQLDRTWLRSRRSSRPDQEFGRWPGNARLDILPNTTDQ